MNTSKTNMARENISLEFSLKKDETGNYFWEEIK